MTYRIGSLCSGYEGLSIAVQAVLGGELAFVADNDPGASAILAHRFPSVPNLGDITKTDWAAVEPVDIVTAGFPCQPVSAAGRRKGTDDERWLWGDITAAIGRMVTRPWLLVLENVPGLLSANRGDAMERVVQGLAALGYVGRYRVLRASDAGAPHRRERVFILAWPAADTRGNEPGGHGALALVDQWETRAGSRPGDRRTPQDPHRPTSSERRFPAPGQETGRGTRADTGGPGGAPVTADTDSGGRSQRRPGSGEPPGSTETDGCTSADAAGNGREQGWPESAGIIGGSDAAQCGDGPAADTQGGRSTHQPNSHRAPRQPLCAEPRTGHGTSGGNPAEGTGEPRRGPGIVAWGAYEPAIHRWEAALGRPAPRPTEPGRTGERLSPAFVEWMQGLPSGWVTGVPGLSRNAQLKALGNGVVPQQAELALRLLLGAITNREAA